MLLRFGNKIAASCGCLGEPMPHKSGVGRCPPSLSVSRAVQYLKGRSSHKLLSEFASLRKRYWGQHL